MCSPMHAQGSQKGGYFVDTLYDYCGILICVSCVSEEADFVHFNGCTEAELVEYPQNLPHPPPPPTPVCGSDVYYSKNTSELS